MPLFQQSILKKHIESFDAKHIEERWQLFKSIFHTAEKQQNIRNSKEEQYQEGFLRDLFVTVLGYTINPEPNYNLLTEQKNVNNSKKADGAILIDGRAVGVIELKGTETTDLNKIEIQAFGYKNNQPGCNYVITSNFEKLRFYIDNTTQQEEFNLFTLTKAQFETMYACLAWESISRNMPMQLLNESVSKENIITKSLYKDYSEFKRALFANMVELNPHFDKLVLFKKTQKLLDRFLFIFFAEDRGLLPTNLIFRINKEWENIIAQRIPVSLYDRYKMYFNDLNVGAKVTLPAFGKKTGEAITAEFEIFAYNGGLFVADDILDNIHIDDNLLYTYTQKMSHYNFESDVDVNILGHIFENSLNEIDEIKSELEGNVLEKTKTRRKKDGVFYTPKYITKYIVDNTVGKLCAEKKEELKLNDEDFIQDKKLQTKTKKALLAKLTDYRNWLLDLTICDPACGSGAFLNQALEFLIAEHRYVDELQAKLLGESLILSDIENSILERNIYGVDLNDESVEIAKLSLWLRTAQKGRKLNSLNNNIKCGNSLIDDPAVAGDKAFSWEKEFPEVFERGGFDVVIGNPPYVRVQGLKEHYFEQTKYYESKFVSAKGNYDIYAIFMEKSFDLISTKGIVSFILPHKFLVSEFGEGIRSFFLKTKSIIQINHFQEHEVFEDASTYTCIIDFGKKESESFYVRELEPKKLFDNVPFYNIQLKALSNDKWILKNPSINSLISKLNIQKKCLGDVIKVFSGIQTSGDQIYILKGDINGDFLTGFSSSLNKDVEIEKSIIKPIVKGDDIKRYETLNNTLYVIFPYDILNGVVTPINEETLKINYPKTYNYLKEHESTLRGRENGKMDREGWYLYVYPKNLVSSNLPKLLSPDITFGLNVTRDIQGICVKNGAYGIQLKEKIEYSENMILALLNSTLLWFYLKQSGNVLRGGYFRFNTKYINPFPIPKININSQSAIDELVKKIFTQKELFQKANKTFSNYFGSKYYIDKLPGKLEKWYEIEFVDFIKELNKAIKGAKGTPLTKKDEFEWMELFEENRKKALELKAEIDRTDKEIDQMVYELYGLTEEEIKVVEGA
jgi:type I restriction-modification system DNA methylase subunit